MTVTEADLINLGLTPEQAAQQLAALQGATPSAVPQGTTVAQGTTALAPIRRPNPLLGPAAQLVGANIPGVPAFGQTISSGIGSMAKAAAVKMGLMAPAGTGISAAATPLITAGGLGTLGPGGIGAASLGGVAPATVGMLAPSTMGAITPAMHAGLAAPAIAGWMPPALVGMLILQSIMTPKKGPADYAAAANQTFGLLQGLSPEQLSDPHFGPSPEGGGGRREGQLNTPKKMHWMLKDALFARDRGGENLLHPQLQSAVQGLDWFLGPRGAEGPVEKTDRGAHGILGSQAMRKYLGFPALLPAQIIPGSDRGRKGAVGRSRRMASGELRGGGGDGGG